MIVIETDRIYSIYTRTNRRVQWRYSDYNGRWESPEKALDVAKERIEGSFEYLIEKLGGGKFEQGFVTR